MTHMGNQTLGGSRGGGGGGWEGKGDDICIQFDRYACAHAIYRHVTYHHFTYGVYLCEIHTYTYLCMVMYTICEFAYMSQTYTIHPDICDL